jgi:hypothetical protein
MSRSGAESKPAQRIGTKQSPELRIREGETQLFWGLGRGKWTGRSQTQQRPLQQTQEHDPGVQHTACLRRLCPGAGTALLLCSNSRGPLPCAEGASTGREAPVSGQRHPDVPNACVFSVRAVNHPTPRICRTGPLVHASSSTHPVHASPILAFTTANANKGSVRQC